jgi:hypothetical protein
MLIVLLKKNGSLPSFSGVYHSSSILNSKQGVFPKCWGEPLS